MQTVIITIHLLVVIALVGVVLIQRSEGGGLGIGGGSGFMTARGAKNTLTRLTAILAACFFLTSIILTVMQLVPNKEGANILNQVSGQSGNNLLNQLGGPQTQPDKSGNAAPAKGAAPAKPEQSRAAAPAGNSAAKANEPAPAQSAGGKAPAAAAPANQPQDK